MTAYDISRIATQGQLAYLADLVRTRQFTAEPGTWLAEFLAGRCPSNFIQCSAAIDRLRKAPRKAPRR